MANDRAVLSTKGLGWGPFCSGLIPGLLHRQLGDKRKALLAVLSCAIVFFVGYALVRDRLFNYGLLSPSREGVMNLFSRVLPLGNLPEALNLPFTALGTLFAFEPGFTAERLWRLPRPHEDIGSWLTAASGMLAAFWSADAHWHLRLLRDQLRPGPGIAPALAAGLSWLVPGLGHWRAGQKDKGVLLGAAVVIVFAFGCIVAENHAVQRPITPVWWIGQDLFGLGTLVCALCMPALPVPMTHEVNQLDLGVIMATVAGLMNLVVIVDAYTVAERARLRVAVPLEAKA